MADHDLAVNNSRLGTNNQGNKILKDEFRQKIINKIQDNGYAVDVAGKKLTIKRNGAIIGTIEEVPRMKKIYKPEPVLPQLANVIGLVGLAGNNVNEVPALNLKFVFTTMGDRFAIEELVSEVLEKYNNQPVEVQQGPVPMNINNSNNEAVGGRRKRARKTKKRRHTTKPKRRSHTLRRKY